MLTEEQLAAVDSPSESLLLIAGAGTGKSTVLVERAAKLVQDGVSPSEIMIATFSRRAAESLTHRLTERHPDLAGCYVGTFHSLAFDLMPNKPNILDEETSIALLASCSNFSNGKAATMRDVTERSKHPAIVSYLSSMKLKGQTDYTGLLHWLWENTDSLFIKHILVDEAQDNDDIQWRIVERLQDAGVNVFCVMDPRQQIYEWRGGTYLPGLALRKHLYLTQSWRLSPEIAELSNRLAEMGVPGVKLKPIVGMRESRRIEREWDIADGASAILCRTNRTVESVCGQLDHMKLKYSVVQRKPKRLTPLIQYLASGIKPATDILKHVIFPDLQGGEQVARLKVDMFREEYPDPVDLLYAIQFDNQDYQDEINWWARLARSGYSLETLAQVGAIHPLETEATSGVVVSTIHQAKGLEYDTVIVPEEDYIGSRPEHYRLSLVQVTRAKNRLVVCGSEGHLVRELAKMQDAT